MSDRAASPNDAASLSDDARSGKSRRHRRGPNRTKVRLSWRKKLAFAAATTVVALLLFEGGLWLFGVRPVIATEDPYVGFSSLSPLFAETKDADGNALMVTAENKRKAFNVQSFLRDKPDGTYRIFCLGGSTTFGRPYDDETSFCGFLRKYLPAADSSHEWEVINCGGISYASYREAIIVEEACRYEPDLFIFYGSQNEFLEARTYRSVIETPPMVRGLGSLASRTRVYAAAHWAVQAARGTPDDDDRDTLDEDVETRLDRSIGPTDYARDDEQRQQIVEHFRLTLSRMIDTARASGADVLLVQPASNLRHCSPFKSEHSADVASDDEKLAEYRRNYGDAQTKLQAAIKLADVVAKANLEKESKSKKPADQTEKPENREETDKPDDKIDVGAVTVFHELNRAQAAIERAIAIDPRFADGHYLHGQILDQLNEFDDAKRAYQRALEEDVCPLRAVRGIAEVIGDVATDRDANVVDFAELIADASPHGVADRTWFLDHVHPSPGGHQLLAQAIVDRMIDENIVRRTGAWTDETKQRVAQAIIDSIDRQAHGRALRNLSKVLEWAGKYEESTQLASQAASLAPTDAESYFRAAAGAAAQGQYEKALELYEQCLSVDPKAAVTYNAAGGIYEHVGQFDDALKYYRKAVEYAAQDNQRRIAVQARTLVGGALMKLNRLDEAEKELRAAITQDPTYAEARNRLGLAFARGNKLPAALEQFAAAGRIEPRNASFLRNSGATLMAMGRHADAKEKFVAALAIERGDPSTHANLASAHLALGDADAAEGALRDALRIDAKFEPARGELARLLVERKQLDEAEKVLAASDGPQTLEATANLAWRLAVHPADDQRDGKRAIAWAERVRKAVGDENAAALDVLAAAYAEAGRFDDAVATANLAVAAALEAEDDDLAKAAKQRLEAYRQNKPHRDPAYLRQIDGPK